MRGISHSSAGALSAFVLLPFLGEINVIYIVAAVLGGLIPDLDANESMIKHFNIPITKKFRIKPFLIPAMIVSRFCKHRGGVHSLFGLILFTFFIQGFFWFFKFTLYPYFSLTFALGYFSHLLLDSWTISGVPLLYPYSQKKYHLFPKSWLIRTGSFAECFFDIAFLLIFVFLLLYGMMEQKFATASVFP